MENGRILVVEDNRDNMTLITDILESLNYTVISAYDGQQGVLMAESEHPNLILMDLSLPLMDGWTAAAEIKKNANLKQIPIIALTAHAMSGDRERAIEAGCDDYVSKPINVPDLLVKITTLLAANK
ncbi:MAG: response regulator [Anaerolineaceae bacterium]|nr:response regulator [Anaerolineaceae bacterium]